MADAAAIPNDYRDPYWSDLASTTEQKLGLPDGLLSSIVQNGEKSNADQVSSAGARTPFQITPATRKAALDKYGVDAYLSPENAAEVSGRLLKDSLERNKGDAAAAVGEYHGGTDRSNWGAKTQAYIQRVLGNEASGAPASTFDKLRAQQAVGAAPSIANVYAAYRDGKMTPEDAAAFEQEVQAGSIMLPRGAKLKPGAGAPPNANPGISDPAAPAAAQGATPVPAAMLAAYKSGQMPQQDRQDFEALVRSGQFTLPQGVDLGTPEAPHPDLIDRAKALPGAIKEAVTGAQRTTPEVQQAINDGRTFYNMPETDNLSWGVVKGALGGLFADSKERAQIVAHNFPGVTVRQDDHGNQWLKSPTDGREYVIPPGFKLEDIPRTVAGIAAFVPAGGAETLPGMMAGGAATQAAIEASQAATGGSFDPSQVAIAGALPAAVAGVGAVARAAASPVRSVISRVIPGAAAETPAETATAGAMEDSAAASPAPAAGEVPVASPVAADAAPQVPAAPAPAPAEPVAPMTGEQLAATAKQAANGSQDARTALAQQAAPDQKVVDAAKRLGIEDYLQPDHVTTNQAYRELAQAVKSVPGSTARASELEGLGNVAQRADKLIDEIGGTTDYSNLSADVKKSLQDTHEQLKSKADDLYNQVRDAIPAKADAPAPTVLTMIRSRADELGGAQNLSSTERMILSKLSPKPVTTTEAVPGNPLMPGAQSASTRAVQAVRQPSYALLDDVRRDLTAALYKNRGPFKDTDQALITRLQGALRQDQEAVAQQYGMGDTWNLAQQTASVYKGIQNDLTSLFGKNLDGSIVSGLGLGVKRLASGDVSSFIRLIKAVPEDMRPQVVASGLNTAFGKAANRGTISFPDYANWYEGLLRNKQAYTALMANLPQAARKQLSDLYRVARSISLASKERIATGRLQVVAEQIKGAESLTEKLYNVARQSAAGAAAASVVGHIPVVGHGAAAAVASALTPAKPAAIKAVDELIASPEFIHLAKSANTAAQPAAVSRFASSKEFVKFMRSLGLRQSVSDRERWVLDALQGGNETNHNQQK